MRVLRFRALRYLWLRHPVALSAFLIASAFVLFFAVRTIGSALYWAAHENEPLRGWMTPGYVERSWSLPRRTLAEPLGLKPPEPGQHPQTLTELAAARGITVEDMIGIVDKLVAAAVAGKAAP